MNPLALPLLILAIMLFFALVALYLAFCVGIELNNENEDLKKHNKSLRDELYNRIMYDKKNS